MAGAARRLPVLLAVLVAPLLFGCSWASLTVQIDDFTASEVLGISVHRLDEATGTFVHHADIEFLGTTEKDGVEFLEFRFHDFELDRTVNLQTELVDLGDDRVQLRLVFSRLTPGVFKVSAYNAYGDSGLSEGSVRI